MTVLALLQSTDLARKINLQPAKKKDIQRPSGYCPDLIRMLSALLPRLLHAFYLHLHLLFSTFAILGSVPYTRFGLIRVLLASFSSTFPNTSSKCSPSPSSSRIAKTRTGSLKMLSSMIPAQVFFRSVVGVEFIASAVTSPMESQHVEETPM